MPATAHIHAPRSRVTLADRDEYFRPRRSSSVDPSRPGRTLSVDDPLLRQFEQEDAGWADSWTKDDARDKAISSHETMGLVSALLAGFELQCLTEVEICSDPSECTGMESAFVITASYCVGLAMLVVLETSFEYMFVMRELHHGHESAWNLIRAFAPYRRAAELTFSLEIFFFLLSTGLMVHVRFGRALAGGTFLAQLLLGVNVVLIFVLMSCMQRAKLRHGEGKKIRQREAQERREERRRRRQERLQGASEKGATSGSSRQVHGAPSLKKGGSIKDMLRSCGGTMERLQVHPTNGSAVGGGGSPEPSGGGGRDGCGASGAVAASDERAAPATCIDRQLTKELEEASAKQASGDRVQLLASTGGAGGRSDGVIGPV